MLKTIKTLFAKPTIKGNIRKDGRKIYHMPEGKLYDLTKAEVMFKSEKQAQKAGFVKSKY